MRADNGGLISAVVRLLEERLGTPVRLVTPRAGGDAFEDVRLRLGREGSEVEFRTVIKDKLTPRDIDSLPEQASPDAGGEFLLVAPALPPKAAERLRAGKINHADLAGNVFIRHPALYVWLQADRVPRVPREPAHKPINPFSRRASLVIRALLEHPRKRWGIRELSAETGLSPGHSSEIAQAIVARGYARQEDGLLALGDPVAALRDWTAVYDWRKNRMRSFLVPFESDEIVPRLNEAFSTAAIPFALTLLAGAERVAPHVRHEQTHVYVSPDRADDAIGAVRDALYGEPVASGGTLHVMNPYHGNSVFYGQRSVDGVPVVSDTQLFIDLADYPLRGAEAARMLALGPIASRIGLSRARARELAETVD